MTAEALHDFGGLNASYQAVRPPSYILLKEEPIGDANDKKLQNLRAVLIRVKAHGDAAKDRKSVV